MAQKIYDAQIPVCLNPRVAEQIFYRGKDDYYFLILWTKKNKEEEIVYL